MALKNLSTRTMVKLGDDLVREDSPERLAIEAVPKAAVLLPDLERAQAGIIAAQPPSQADIDALTRTLTRDDARHDELVRCIDDRLTSEQAATKSPTVRATIAEVRVAVLATGRAIINRSYLDQSGEGVLRAARVTDAHRAVLRKLKTYEGTTFEELFDELQAVAAEIGAIEKQRSDREAALARLEKNREARSQWILVVNCIAQMLELAHVDEGPILGNVREAEAKADLRVGHPDEEDEDLDASGSGGGGTGAGGTGGGGTGGGGTGASNTGTSNTGASNTGASSTGTSATDVLDPPAPADDGEPRGPTS